ncbi:MAG: hypothetical protein M3R16_01060 [Pseudomonadota bacterium]|nr:hypothetical protein [Pseudomonadota bacterium]
MDKSKSFASAHACVRSMRTATVIVLGGAIMLIASGCERAVGLPPAPTALPAGVSASSQPSAPVVPVAPTCLITGTAIGPVQLGVRLDDAQSLMPQATFTRTSDGEGVALVEVAVDGASLALLYAGEEDPKQPVDVTRPIEFLETFNPACATPEGIHPGSTVEAAEAAYGAAGSISRSEIESREYIQFTHPPAGLQFRLDYSGEFADGENETRRHGPGAKIFSISVSRQ